MTRDPVVYLSHIQLCIDRILLYTQEGRDGFLADTKTQDAVIRNLEIIGQAARDFGIERLAAAEPALPWVSIAGLRNVLAINTLAWICNWSGTLSKRNCRNCARR